MVHYKGLLVRVEEQGVLYQTVEIGGNHQIILIGFRQQMRQGMIADAGLAFLHDLLQIPVTAGFIGTETKSVNIEVIFTEVVLPGPRFFLVQGFLPGCLNVRERMLQAFVFRHPPSQFSGLVLSMVDKKLIRPLSVAAPLNLVEDILLSSH